MLQRFLSLVQAGEFQSLLEIARQMNVSVDMVRRMAAELTEKGYLEEIRLDCDEPAPGCSSCPIRGKCQTTGRQWVLTGKGKAAISTE
jgi:DNA-binding Lrp family transcriptional regulator